MLEDTTRDCQRVCARGGRVCVRGHDRSDMLYGMHIKGRQTTDKTHDTTHKTCNESDKGQHRMV